MKKQARETAQTSAASTSSADDTAKVSDAGVKPDTVNTPDEETFSTTFNGSFHKLLEHDQKTGLLTSKGSENYKKLKAGLQLDKPNDGFDQTQLNDVELAIPASEPKRRILINPQSSKALTINGEETSDVKAHEVITRFYKEVNKNAPGFYFSSASYGTEQSLLKDLSFTSSVTAAETLEAYVMVLLRDVPFTQYKESNLKVKLAIDALNEFDADIKNEQCKLKAPKQNIGTDAAPDYKVTAKTLLRGSSPGDVKGDYLSKFFELLRPPLFPSGCAPHVANLINASIFFKRFGRRLEVPKPNPKSEWGLTWNDFVRIQNGYIPRGYKSGDFLGDINNLVPVSDGRRLGTLVHIDGFYEEFLWAVDVLTAGNYPRTMASNYSMPSLAPNEGDGPTLGVPNAASLVGAVALDAGRLAWRQKWVVARRGRPEVIGGLIHRLRKTKDTATYGNLDPKLLQTTGKIGQVFEAIKKRNKALGGKAADTYLLSQLFPEASPSHPAWTSGHATVAGACVTVIKAIFNDQTELRDNKGNPYPDGNGGFLRVGEELDKLASNIALGRNFGGVHFRSDGEHGILIGEEIAIRFLQKHLTTFKEKFRNAKEPYFELTRRSGQRIRITASQVSNVNPAAARAAAANLSNISAENGTIVI